MGYCRSLLSVAVPAIFTMLFASLGARAQSAQDPLAFARAQHLRHGINASIWFAQSPRDYSVQRLQTFTTADDIALMAAMGLDHVRLSIDADPLAEWQRRGGETTPFVTELDRVVKTILDDHLSVIIDIHPESSYKAPLRQGSASVQQFVNLWRTLAGHYASTDPEHVFFEIMNEPEQDDPYRWQGIESVVAEAIRAQAPQHTIIAAGARWSGLEDLLHLAPIALPNVIYTFHDYEPFPFTHQGATWTTNEVRPLRKVPYPSSPESVASQLDEEPDLAGKFFLEQYGLGRWDAARVDRTISYAAMWSDLHHVPVYCGEFGVLREYADPAARAQWLHDMRVTLEKYTIGWAMWDYQTNFGLVIKANGTTTPDPEIVKALGLHLPKQ
jgi:endoglucanase